jgi:hypothetical protein
VTHMELVGWYAIGFFVVYVLFYVLEIIEIS